MTTCIEIEHHPDSTQRFARLAQLPWAMLLDSGRPRARGGRYDILVADPATTLVTRGSETVIEDAWGRTLSTEDPFVILRELLGPARTASDGLPFSGGAVGYFAYDLARRLERLPALAIADGTLPDMAVGLYETACIVDHDERRTFIVGDDPARVEAWRRWLRPLDAGPAVASAPSFQVLAPVAPEIDRGTYARGFARIKRYIVDGDCYQVNYTQRFSAPVTGDPWEAYRWLRNLNPAPYAAYLNVPGGAVVSSSPERFLRVRERRVETRPIKGTRPRSSNPARDAELAAELAASAKDRAENVMIVDLLRNDLGKICEPGSVTVPVLFAIESYATVHHLVSTVCGRLPPGAHVVDLLRGAFPGGSITGAPKLRAMQIIEELESHRRGVYCGAIGYIGRDGAMDTNIAIRTLSVDAGRMLCWAGGGIVHDSVLDDEYQESLDKAAAMLAVFGRTIAHRVGPEARR